jgi:glyoxylase I family protein
VKLHHVAIATPDPEALAAFYMGVLAFERVEKANSASVWLALGDALLMLEKSQADDIARPFSEKRKGLHLLAFAVTAAEREAWRQRLQKAGVAIEAETPHSLYFFDPDGNRIALSHYPHLV